MVKPFKGAPLADPKYVVIQDEFDLQAARKVAEVDAQTWDDFYEQMEELFLHEGN